MELNFIIQQDRLISGSVLEGNSGNVGTYICNFDILDNKDFLWFCVFKKGDAAYQQVIEDGKCVIPKEVLEESGKIEIGCYGTHENMRISTNWLTVFVKDGAYCDATAPEEPTPDVWEVLVMNTLPYIGETGNWYVYDKEKKEYVDSGVSAMKSEEPHWELISSGELTEEVASLTIDGFSCSKIVLKVTVKGSVSNASDDVLQFRTNHDSNSYGGTNIDLTRTFRDKETTVKLNMSLEMKNKWITGQLFSSAGAESHYINDVGYDSIKGLYLRPKTAGIVFGVGTTYELWGVRK